MAGIKIEYPYDVVWFIVDKNTKWVTIMSKSIKDLTIYEIEGIDTKGHYYSTKEKAEEALQELR